MPRNRMVLLIGIIIAVTVYRGLSSSPTEQPQDREVIIKAAPDNSLPQGQSPKPVLILRELSATEDLFYKVVAKLILVLGVLAAALALIRGAYLLFKQRPPE